uniref:Ubiquitin-like protease family profile domain-containing protein n=1 Tax=Amphimedon queenslandica TaxID=400682 RepID=A0A1X7SQ81_AMPQE
MEVTDGKPKKQVLSQLRRNVRKKNESKGGRKHPHLRDIDVIDEEGESEYQEPEKKKHFTDEEKTADLNKLNDDTLLSNDKNKVIDLYIKVLAKTYSTEERFVASLPCNFMDSVINMSDVSNWFQHVPVVNFILKRILLLDSLSDAQFTAVQHHTRNIKELLIKECNTRNLRIDITYFKEDVPLNVAQQTNAFSSGVYVCKVIDDISLRKEIANDMAQ